MIKRLASLSFLVVLAFGCNRGDSSAGSSSSGTETATGAGATPGKKIKVVYIPKQSGNPYFNEVDRGFKEASTQFGFDYVLTAPSSGDATSQVPILKDQIQQGVDVIAISANGPDALNSVLDEAKRNNITVLTVDADLVGNETHRDAAVLPTDFDKVGASQIELLGSQMGYQGDFAILSATADAPNQNAWIAGMKTALKDPKYAKMKLVDTVYGDDEPQKSTTECEALISKHPGLAGIVSPTSVGLAAAAQVVERTGVYPKGAHATGSGLHLTGLSTPNQLKKFVKNGVVQAFQLWLPYNEGFVAGYVATQIHGGKLKPAAGGDVDVPKLGKRTFSAKLELFGGPLITFDKSDIDKYDF